MTIAPTISLRCSVCGAEPPKPEALPSWAGFAAFGDAVQRAGAYADADPLALAAGAPMTLSVHHPFATAADGTFRFLAMPRVAAANGWAEDMPALEHSAVISAQLTAVPDGAPSAGGVTVTAVVTDAVSLPALADRPPLPGPVSLPGDRHQTEHRSRWRDWDLIEASSEGDVGWWLLTRHNPDGPLLVAQGDWWAHGDRVLCGPARITPAVWQDWNAALDQAAADRP